MFGKEKGASMTPIRVRQMRRFLEADGYAVVPGKHKHLKFTHPTKPQVMLPLQPQEMLSLPAARRSPPRWGMATSPVCSMRSRGAAGSAGGPADDGSVGRDGEEVGMDLFMLADLRARQRQSGQSYLEFLRVPSLRTGLYALPAGGVNPQRPHAEDESTMSSTGAPPSPSLARSGP